MAVDSRAVSKHLIGFMRRRAADPKDIWGIPWGYDGLDRLTGGIQAEQMSLLAARPGVGKSMFGGQVALSIARWLVTDAGREAHPGGVVRLVLCEMSAPQFQDRMVCQLARVPAHKVRSGRLSAEQQGRYVVAAKTLATLPIEYLDDPSGLRDTVRFIEAPDGRPTAWWMVDYIGIHPAGNGINEAEMTRKVTYLSAGFRDLARETAPGLVLAQLNRQVEQRDDKRPRLSDLRDSGSLEQDASGVVLGLYREDIYRKLDEDPDPDAAKRPKPAELLVLKHRSGMLGTVDMTWVPTLPGFLDATALRDMAEQQADAEPAPDEEHADEDDGD